MACDEKLDQIYSANPELDEKINLWFKWDRCKKTRKQMEEWVEARDWDLLRDRLLSRIQFGTAGLRGCMRAGFDSMNELVVVQAAQGLSRYITGIYTNQKDRQQRGFLIGYDGRHDSKRFAELSAAVFLHRGFKVWLYGRMVCTPFVPYGILKLKCLAGVMVTASHNPKEENGYKVYWENGAQIIPPHDSRIQIAINNQLTPQDYSWDTDILCTSQMVADPFERISEVYYREIRANIPAKFLEINGNSCKTRFIYTALHGVGYPFVLSAFQRAKLKSPIPVEEQVEADPDFPTIPFPNPEDSKSAFKLSIETAERAGITTILANDPDADRLAVAQKNPKTKVWKIFTGNEIGALLGWWAIQNCKELHPDWDMANCWLIASTVSSKILAAMARIEGLNFVETLTGFKWMGNKAIELLAQGKKVLFAFEESIGYMFGTTVFDKDGINAAVNLATMACYLQTECLTLTDMLDQIYTIYGYHCTNNSYYLCYEPPVVERMFNRMRNWHDRSGNYPRHVVKGEFRIKHVRDLTVGVDTQQPNGKAILPVNPSTQMITFSFTNGMIMTIRTSGTEPKIKYYAEMCAKPEETDWKKLRATLDRMVEAIVSEFIQPKKNDLKPKKD